MNNQIAGAQHASFSKAQEKDKRIKRRAHNGDELRRADSQLESEGEAGDNNVYAQWAGATMEDPRAKKPLPKFEKSVFDMSYQKNAQSSQQNWRNKDVDKSQDKSLTQLQAADQSTNKKGKHSERLEERRQRRSMA